MCTAATPAKLCSASRPHGCVVLQKVVFTDLSSEATSALSAELARQAPQYRLSLEGSPAACHKAVQLLTASHEVSLSCQAALAVRREVSLSAALC